MDENIETVVIKDSTEKYDINNLITNCEALTGYKEEVAAGALFNCDKNEMTKEEFKGRIKNFIEKEVR